MKKANYFTNPEAKLLANLESDKIIILINS